MLSGLLDKFEEVMAEGTNPQQQDLLHLLVKKVLVHDRRTIEIWYALPNQASVRTPAHLAPRMCQCTNQAAGADSNVWFRVDHVGEDQLPAAPRKAAATSTGVAVRGASPA
jgi:hypothetical protein